MADLGENLRTVIVASTAVLAECADIADGGRCTQGTEVQSPTLPRIWYARSSEREDLDLGGEGGLVESEWDLEVISDDLDEAQDLAHVVKRFLRGKRGTFGTQTVLGTFVEDHNDEYISKSVDAESGYQVAALRVRIFHEST